MIIILHTPKMLQEYLLIKLHNISDKNIGTCDIYFTDQDLIPVNFNNINNQFEVIFYEKNKEDFHLKEFLAHYIETYSKQLTNIDK